MSRRSERIIEYSVQDGYLVRRVTPSASGRRPYLHRCSEATYRIVAHALSEVATEGEGTGLERIAEQEDLPYSQVNVAMEFMKERGIIEVRRRHSYPATEDVYLDAMIEFHALAAGVEDNAHPDRETR